MTTIFFLKNRIFIFITFLLCSSGQIYAGQGKDIDWPFATSVTAQLTEGGGVVHYIQYKVTWVNSPITNSSSDNLVATMCASGCSIFEYIKFFDYGTNYWSIGPSFVETYLGVVSTWSELSAKIKNTPYGANGSFLQLKPIDGVGDGCAGLMIGRRGAAAKKIRWEEFISRGIDPQGQTVHCLPLPPGENWCALVTPELNFNHGIKVISDYKVNGSTVTVPVKVECTGAIKFMLKLANGSSGVHLSNGLTANLQVEGKPLGTSLNGESGIHTLNISSTLTGDKPVAGNFNGTSILMVSYP